MGATLSHTARFSSRTTPQGPAQLCPLQAAPSRLLDALGW